VIDLARVGTSTGLDAVLVDRVRTASPGLTLVAGGGVRGWSDLVRLAEAGCDGALVATALHEGTITADDIQAARTL
jgi:phosphoribosylformimino-5-aminoimidazole carboxamide ribotide isomerase